MNKKSLSEQDIRSKFILPALTSAGWDLDTQLREEVALTSGRVVVRAGQPAGCRAGSHRPGQGQCAGNGGDRMNVPTLPARSQRLLTAEQFHQLAAVPAEAEWFANLDNPRTGRAYQIDLQDFMGFAGIRQADEFRMVTRAHVLAWRKVLEDRALSGATIRRKLAALSSLFEYLCEKNAVDFNPVKGAKRPKVDSNEGKTPALGDHQARALLDAPDPATLKGQRDRAMLAVLLYHGLRREQLCLLMVRDIHDRRGIPHLRVHGKGGKTRYVPLHPASAERLHTYVEAAGHAMTPDAALFQPTRKTGNAITADGVYKCVLGYAAQARISVEGFGVHSLRATAATNALDHEADIAKVQEWLGHAKIATTRIYDRRRSRPD